MIIDFEDYREIEEYLNDEDLERAIKILLEEKERRSKIKKCSNHAGFRLGSPGRQPHVIL